MARSELRPSELPHPTVAYLPVRLDELGEILVAPAVPIDARWEEARAQSADAKSEKEAVTHRVFTLAELPIGTILWRGEFTAIPQDPTNLFVVVRNKTIEDLKGLTATRYAMVAKHPNRIRGA